MALEEKSLATPAIAWQIIGLKSEFIDGILLRISEGWQFFFMIFFSITVMVAMYSLEKAQKFDCDKYWALLPDLFC